MGLQLAKPALRPLLRNLRLAPISTSPKGSTNTLAFRLYFEKEGKTISPWHSIPLNTDRDKFHFVVEIPKFTRAKMEVATREECNPIAQDIKKGELRFYHGPIFWNYGLLPQTWEDPNHVHPELQLKGDNDPVDVVEIGTKALPMGTVAKIKPLGIIAVIDEGELDWKVIAINTEDQLANQLNDIHDVRRIMPGVVSGIREWFRWYKTPDSKPINEIGFDEKVLPKTHALEVISETHGYWKALAEGKAEAGELWKI